MDPAQLIRQVRERTGMTLRELASRAGTSDATLSAYETRRVTPRVDTLDRIVRAAGFRLGPSLSPMPNRDPRRRSAAEELWSVLELVDWLPTKERHERPQAPHAIFGPQ